MEILGVITRAEEPTEWCTGMVVVPKKSPEQEGSLPIAYGGGDPAWDDSFQQAGR